MKKPVTLEMVKQAGMVLKKVNEEKLRLEKEAGDFRLEKRAMAVAFREVELGISEPFHSYGELMSKVASLVHEDLDVVEKALERGYGNSGKIGILDDERPSERMNVLEKWVLTGEL
jgi:hypothetical protein